MMSKLENYEVVTDDQSDHVYIAVSEAVVGQILPCKRERSNIHDSYTVENNDTPIDNNATVLHDNFRG